MRVVFVISSFGLGHLTRQIALKNALLTNDPDIEIVFVTSERQEQLMSEEIISSENVYIERIPLTPQVTMDDWTQVDKESTREIFLRFWEWETQIRDDTEWGRILFQADLVINDIESVHNPIASKMGIPIINISNFTWSDILEHLELFELANNYRQWEGLSTYDFLLPFNTECKSFSNPQETKLLVRSIDWEVVNELSRSTDATIVMINYSHNDITIDLAELAEMLLHNNYQVIIPERYASSEIKDQCILIPSNSLTFQNYHAAADIVVSKIGYGTLSEVLVGGTKFLYWMREGFVEDNALHEGVQQFGIGERIDFDITPQKLLDKIKLWEGRKSTKLENGTSSIAEQILALI